MKAAGLSRGCAADDKAHIQFRDRADGPLECNDGLGSDYCLRFTKRTFRARLARSNQVAEAW